MTQYAVFKSKSDVEAWTERWQRCESRTLPGRRPGLSRPAEIMYGSRCVARTLSYTVGRAGRLPEANNRAMSSHLRESQR